MCVYIYPTMNIETESQSITKKNMFENVIINQ